MENSALMTQARARLEGKWTPMVLASLINMAIQSGPSAIPVIGPLAQLALSGPLSYGFASMALRTQRGESPEVGDLFAGFKSFGRFFVAYLLMTIFVLLWSLLLIIPGIIAAYAYAMTFFIMADDKDISASDAITKSRRMMDGHKWKLFCLGWRFFGWALLCLLSCGVGFLWLAPYVTVSMAGFYDDIKGTQAGDAVPAAANTAV